MAMRKMISIEKVIAEIKVNIDYAENRIQVKSFGAAGTHLATAERKLTSLSCLLNRQESRYHDLHNLLKRIYSLKEKQTAMLNDLNSRMENVANA